MVREKVPPFFGKEGKVGRKGRGMVVAALSSLITPQNLLPSGWHSGQNRVLTGLFTTLLIGLSALQAKGLVPGTSGAPRGHRGDVGVISVISVIGRVIFGMTVFGWMDDRAWQLCLQEKAEMERKEGRKSCERTSWRRRGY